MKRLRFFLYIVLITIFGFLGLKALFHSGFYTSLDGWHNIARLYHFHNAVRDGQLPPRWIADLASGYGYPLFIFSYHMPWILAEPFLFLGVGVIDTVKIIFLIGFVLSGIFFFLWLREVFDETSAFVASVVYMWAPYRFSKILVGASIGEATVFLFLPLLLWSLYRLSIKPSRKALVVGMVGLSGIILSHIIMLPILSFFLFFYIVYLFSLAKEKKDFLKNSLVIVLGSIALTVYYWLPILTYSSVTRVRHIQVGFADLYKHHFVTFSQLLYSKWGYGPITSSAKDGEVSFQIGIVQWIGVMGSIGIIVFLFIKERLKKISSQSLTNKRVEHFIVVCLVSYGISIYLMLDQSRIMWDRFHTLLSIDFPWRFIAMTTLLGSILVGYLVYHFPRWQEVLAVLLIGIALLTNRNHIRVNEYTDIPLSLYVDSEKTTNTYAEYLPSWSHVDIGKSAKTIIDPSDDLSANLLFRNTWKILMQVSAKTSTNILVNHIDFPGLAVYVDDKRIAHTHNTDGRISFGVSPGVHKILLIYEQTPLMKLTNALSLLSLITIFFLMFYSGRKLRPVFFRK